ncbi:hypothetical protein CAOG_07890 [Capsaspora owczarzaki ATCC 30864]|nr:hypothetical protein CAOG_07890 [Capsaspora owczarzaki ATCC 30864]|eukprot:XP_004342975.2 hypothetical protein CAOG_07890 [Capsaspora owczarzaki ATCC 30864]
MNVDRSNFASVLPLVKQAIAKCDFVAIDAEFTGLHSERAAASNHFDTLAERYAKVRRSASQFGVLQYGVCAFRWLPERHTYEAQPFNFYVFQRPATRESPDAQFLSQASSIEFLIDNHFDFTRSFKTGITFINRTEEVALQEAYFDLATKQHHFRQVAIKNEAAKAATAAAATATATAVAAATATASSLNQDAATPMVESAATETPVPAAPLSRDEKNKILLQSIMDTVAKWMAEPAEPTLLLPVCTSYMRRLVYQAFEQKYPVGFLVESIDPTDPAPPGHKAMTITRGTAEEKAQRQEARTQAQLAAQQEIKALADEMMHQAIGFRHVIDCISEHKKLVVGHNMLLDLAHTFDKFIGDLPEQLDDFKNQFAQVFPYVADTKHLASSSELGGRFESTALADLVRTLLYESDSAPINVELPDEFNAYPLQPVSSSAAAAGAQPNERLHEAGYDAYITGLGFVALAHKLAHLRSERIAQNSALGPLLGHLAAPNNNPSDSATPPKASPQETDSVDMNQEPDTSRPAAANVEQSILEQSRPKGGLALIGPSTPAMAPYINKLHVMRSDYRCLDLASPDVYIPRPRMLFVHGFPDSWRESNVRQVFNNAQLGTRSVGLLTRTSALVAIDEGVSIERITAVVEATRQHQNAQQQRRAALDAQVHLHPPGLLGPPPAGLMMAVDSPARGSPAVARHNSSSVPSTPTGASAPSNGAADAAASSDSSVLPFFILTFSEYQQYKLNAEATAVAEQQQFKLEQEQRQAAHLRSFSLEPASFMAPAAASSGSGIFSTPRPAGVRRAATDADSASKRFKQS